VDAEVPDPGRYNKKNRQEHHIGKRKGNHKQLARAGPVLDLEEHAAKHYKAGKPCYKVQYQILPVALSPVMVSESKREKEKYKHQHSNGQHDACPRQVVHLKNSSKENDSHGDDSDCI
jgi:hypothetical protein